MIKNGFRLYRDLQGKLRLDLITDGMVSELEVPRDFSDKKLGYYDEDMRLVEEEGEV